MSPELHQHKHTVKAQVKEQQAAINKHSKMSSVKAPPPSVYAKEARRMHQSGYGQAKQKHNHRKYSRRSNSWGKQREPHALRNEGRYMHILRQNKGSILRYLDRRQRKCLRIFYARPRAWHHSGCIVSVIKNNAISEGYFVTDHRIGEASNPGLQPRSQRMYMANKTKVGKDKHPRNDTNNSTDKDGLFKNFHLQRKLF